MRKGHLGALWVPFNMCEAIRMSLYLLQTMDAEQGAL